MKEHLKNFGTGLAFFGILGGILGTLVGLIVYPWYFVPPVAVAFIYFVGWQMRKNRSDPNWGGW